MRGKKSIRRISFPTLFFVGHFTIQELVTVFSVVHKWYPMKEFVAVWHFFAKKYIIFSWQWGLKTIFLMYIIYERPFLRLPFLSYSINSSPSFFILTASPLLNYSITNLHNSAKRAKQKEFLFYFFHFPLHTHWLVLCCKKKVEWHRVMIHHHLFMINSHRNLRVKKSSNSAYCVCLWIAYCMPFY